MKRTSETVCVGLVCGGLTLLLMGGIMGQHWISKVGGFVALAGIVSVGFFNLRD